MLLIIDNSFDFECFFCFMIYLMRLCILSSASNKIVIMIEVSTFQLVNIRPKCVMNISIGTHING